MTLLLWLLDTPRRRASTEPVRAYRYRQIDAVMRRSRLRDATYPVRLPKLVRRERLTIETGEFV